MEITESTHYRDPLDILRRFVATPLRTRFRAGGTLVQVQTNDFALLPALPLDAASAELEAPGFEWKLVRDFDAFGQLEEALRMDSATLTVVTMGKACLLGMDQQRRELLCFIGADVEARLFQDVLVPFLCSLTNEAVHSSFSVRVQPNQENTVDA